MLRSQCRSLARFAPAGVSLLLGAATILPLTRLYAAESTAEPVAAVKIGKEPLSQQVSFDAELRPYEEINLHAKVSGYLQTLTVDAGDVVKAGQVIATLEVPELQSELEHSLAAERRAQAEVERAEAAYDEAKLSYGRLATANQAQPKLFAQQELDIARARERTAEATLAAAKQQVSAAKADIQKVRDTLGYARIVAPFDGVITKRLVAPGALIQAGTSSNTQPLVRLSQNDRLRVTFPVSMSFVSRVKVGDPVEVRVPSLGRTFQVKLSRLSQRVETATRTMDAEADLPNPGLQIVPGVYATVVVKSERRETALVAPVEAVSRDKSGSRVMVVKPDNTLEERVVTVGLETPGKLEITQGLAENELVLVGNRSQLKAGQSVVPKLIQLPRLE